jgi:hypothetical protein
VTTSGDDGVPAAGNDGSLAAEDNAAAGRSSPVAEARPAPGLVWFDESSPRRPKEKLDRGRIVAAAIELADQEMTGEITMRALAARRHVGSKDGLSDLMADEIYGEITVPAGEGWRPALRGLSTSGWAAVRRHPWFARLAFSRPPLGPGAVAMYDTALAELEPLELDAAARMGFVSTVLGHVLGSGLALLEEQAMRARTGLPTDKDLSTAAAPYLERIAASGKHPHFTRWAADPRRHEAAPQTFERILDWLLDGLEASLG